MASERRFAVRAKRPYPEVIVGDPARCKVARRIDTTGKPVRATVDFAGGQDGYGEIVEGAPRKSLRAGTVGRRPRGF
jgi:hypothetical protein